MIKEEIEKLNATFYQEIENACLRIVGTSGDLAAVETTKTHYVIEGITFNIKTNRGVFPFWIGINGPRIFFIAYVGGIEKDQAAQSFGFCFGGAEKVGWQINYEPIDDGVSIWATCMTDRNFPLSVKQEHVRESGRATYSLTADGLFWATDIAMMVQSWVRTCERKNIDRHSLEPAPL